MEFLKNNFLAGGVIAIALIVFVFLMFGPRDEEDYIRSMIRILNRYGIEAETPPIERVLVSIPETFDEVYENYNELQKKAGFDLKKYRGKNVWRYSFRVTNMCEEQEIRANLLLYKNRVIGGDVMSTSLSGFMVPLNFRSEQGTAPQ